MSNATSVPRVPEDERVQFRLEATAIGPQGLSRARVFGREAHPDQLVDTHEALKAATHGLVSEVFAER
jgi:membrane-bound lytic murein transglycosylase MltF